MKGLEPLAETAAHSRRANFSTRRQGLRSSVPDEVVAVLDLDGIPLPLAETRRSVRETVLIRLMEVIYENTTNPLTHQNLTELMNLSAFDMAKLEALHEIDPVGNRDRICQIERMLNPFSRIYCRE